MAHNFGKIRAPFLRETNKSKTTTVGMWSNPIFEYLQNNEWVWTGKADGTSIGVKWDGERVSFVGHTDKSQIPPKLLNFLTTSFGTDEAEAIFEELFGDKPFTLYGEGLSSETNEDYGFPDGNFILFDVHNDNDDVFWNRDAVENVAQKFNLDIVPILLRGTIMDAVEFVKVVRPSPFDPLRPLEGLVGRPPVELKTTNGDRVICKVKYCDIVGGKPCLV